LGENAKRAREISPKEGNATSRIPERGEHKSTEKLNRGAATGSKSRLGNIGGW